MYSSFIRRNPWNYNQALIVVCNFSPVPFDDYTFGVPVSCTCKEVFSTYDTLPDGGTKEHVPIKTEKRPCDNHPYTVHYSLKPYESAVFEIIPDNQ